MGQIFDPLPVHSHAGSAQGGQLDWDNIFSDAEHSHESSAEGSILNRLGRLVKVGAYFNPWPARTNGTAVIAANTLYAHPFLVARALTIDRLGIRVTTAGAALTVARLGIYSDNGSVYPGALVKDVGTVAVDAIAVVAAAIAGNQALTPGLYWLALISDGAPTLSYLLHSYTPNGVNATNFYNEQATYNIAQAYGALPDPFPAAASDSVNWMLVLPRLLTLD
jgi:hypothetical protein